MIEKPNIAPPPDTAQPERANLCPLQVVTALANRHDRNWSHLQRAMVVPEGTGSAVDAGFGFGYEPYLLCAKGYDPVHAIDINLDVVEISEQVWPGPIYQRANLETWQPPDAPAVVLCSHSLEHVADVGKMMRNLLSWQAKTYIIGLPIGRPHNCYHRRDWPTKEDAQAWLSEHFGTVEPISVGWDAMWRCVL